LEQIELDARRALLRRGIRFDVELQLELRFFAAGNGSLVPFTGMETVIWWSLTNLSRVRRDSSAAMVAPEFAHVRFVRLRSRAQIGQFLERLARGRC